MTIITVDEWRAALDGLNQLAPDAMTAADWAVRLRMPSARAAKWVRAGLEHETMERATTIVHTIDGRARRVTGFRLVTPPQPKGKR
jgi:hypothetical protein